MALVQQNFNTGHVQTPDSMSSILGRGLGTFLDKRINQLDADEQKAYDRGRQKVADERATVEFDRRTAEYNRQETNRQNAAIAEALANDPVFRQGDAAQGQIERSTAGAKALDTYLAQNKNANLTLDDVTRIMQGPVNTSSVGTNTPLLQQPVVTPRGSIGGSGGSAPVYKTTTVPSSVKPGDVVNAPGSKLLFRPDNVVSKQFTPTAGPLERTLEMFSPAKTQKEQLAEINSTKTQKNQYNGKLSLNEFKKLSPMEQDAYTRAAISLLPKDAQTNVNGFLSSMNPTTKRELVRAGTSGGESSRVSSSTKSYTMPADSSIMDKAYQGVYASIPQDKKDDHQHLINTLAAVAGRGGLEDGGSLASDLKLKDIVTNAMGDGSASDRDKALFQIETAKAGNILSQYNSDRQYSQEERKMMQSHSQHMANIAEGRKSKEHDVSLDMWKDARERKTAVWKEALADARSAVTAYRETFKKEPTADNKKRLDQALGYFRQFK